MELVMSNNFYELSEMEWMMIDGGEFDLGQFAGGLFDAAAGVVEGAVGLAGVLTPEPVTSIVGAIAIVDGYDRFSDGVYSIIDAFN